MDTPKERPQAIIDIDVVGLRVLAIHPRSYRNGATGEPFNEILVTLRGTSPTGSAGGPHMPSLLRGIARNALLSVGVLAVSLVVLYPRVTEAEEVSENERYGEFEDDGNRFGDIVIKGELVAANGAPGGWSLVRTAENSSDHAAEANVEERIVANDTNTGSRVGGETTAVLTRHQKIKLGPHEKKVVGTTFAKALGEAMTVNAKIAQGIRIANENPDENAPGPFRRPYKEYRTEYLRELRAGETAMKRAPMNPGYMMNMLVPPPPPANEVARMDSSEL